MMASPMLLSISPPSSARACAVWEEGDKLEFELEVDRRGKTAAVNLVPQIVSYNQTRGWNEKL